MPKIRSSTFSQSNQSNQAHHPTNILHQPTLQDPDIPRDGISSKEDEFKSSFPVYYQLIKYLLIYHKLPTWKIQLDNAKRRAGFCNYQHNYLSFSSHLIGHNEISFEDKANIILHEIAHAKAGPFTYHGPVWKKIAKQIGCDGNTYHNLILQEPRYQYSCPCGMLTFKMYRRTNKIYQCSSCEKMACL